jgi:polysaccharide pyruvyl transferase WcaK-like protein
MRILHVASFHGNVGDNANHNGLRFQLSRAFPETILYDELEIRRFYQKYDGPDKLQFDEAFAALANSHDLVIIGGGNFFEILIESSSTGCTIDIPPKVLDMLTSRILFYGLGFDTYKGSSAATRDKFYRFLQRLLSSGQFLVTVRNDGSVEQLEDCYGQEISKTVLKVPDGGFFIRLDGAAKPLTKPDRCNIVLSIAEDMLSVRFPALDNSSAYRMLVSSFAEYMKRMVAARSGVNFILMPHIYSDLHVMSEIVNALPEYIRRNSVTVGPYVSGPGSESIVFSTYQAASCAVSMRFHGNVVPIGLNVPTLGISTYRKISDLYRELGHAERVLDLGSDRFNDSLQEQTERMITCSREIRSENASINKELDVMMNRFLSELRSFTKA